MAKATVRNPWAGLPNIFTWAQHRAKGYLGGDDFKAAIGAVVTAGATGWATLLNDATRAISIKTADGDSVVHMENKNYLGTFPRQVQLGEAIATVGLVRAGASYVRSPHIHGVTAAGVRGPIANFLREAATQPALLAYQRIVKSVAGVNRRNTPDTKGPILENIKKGTECNFSGWVYGENVGGNNIWFKGRFSDDYFWSGSFENPADIKAGLVDLNTAPVPVPPLEVEIPEAPVTPPVPPVVGPPIPVDEPIEEPVPPVVVPDPEPEPPVVVPEPEPEPPVVVEPVPEVPETPSEPTPEPPVSTKPKPTPAPAVGGLVGALLALVGLVAAALLGLFK